MESADNYTMGNIRDLEWQSSLSVNPEKLQEILASCPEGQNLTYWCLKNQALESSIYLEWAKEHYSLPLLSDSFFFDQKYYIQNIYAQFQDKELWNVNAIPVAEWDDILFVATTEPTTLGYFDKKVQFLLVSQDVLEVQWHKFNSTYTGPTMAEAATTVKPANDSIPQRSQLEETNSSTEDVIADLALLSNNISTDAISLDAELGSTESALAELELTSTNINTSREALEITHSDASDILAELEQATNISTSPSSEQTPIEKEFEDQISTSNIFETINQQFKASMVLSYDTNAQTVTPVSHDGTWDESTQFNSPYDISKPCAFNIVIKTKKAFHGKAFPNTANKNFFKQVGHAVLPPHISLCPIHNNSSDVIGFLLSIGETGQSAKNIESLSFAEQCAADMVGLLESAQSAA